MFSAKFVVGLLMILDLLYLAYKYQQCGYSIFHGNSMNGNSTNHQDTKSHINITKASACLINDEKQSIDGDIYSYKKYGKYLLDLYSLIENGHLIVFVMENAFRTPNMNVLKCDLPFKSFVVSKDKYFIINGTDINNYVFPRPECNESHIICHAKDFRFLINWLLPKNNTKHDINNSWILTLEDDVYLCPRFMESVLNIILNKDYIDTNLWYLGYGQTALLFRQSFVEHYLRDIDRYLTIQKRGGLDVGIDLFMLKDSRHRTDIVASVNNLVYHPSSKLTLSTQEHFYSHGLKCHIERKWPHKWLKYFQTYFNRNTTDLIQD